MGDSRKLLEHERIAEEREGAERFVREFERERMTGLSRSAWFQLERKGQAPKRIRINARTVAWRLSDLQAWIATVAGGRPWSGAT